MLGDASAMLLSGQLRLNPHTALTIVISRTPGLHGVPNSPNQYGSATAKEQQVCTESKPSQDKSNVSFQGQVGRLNKT